MNHIYIISDGTGRTARQTLNAALTQFPETNVEIHLRSNIITKKQIAQVIKEASEAHGFVLHTVVSQTLRREVRRSGRLRNIEKVCSHFFEIFAF